MNTVLIIIGGATCQVRAEFIHISTKYKVSICNAIFKALGP